MSRKVLLVAQQFAPAVHSGVYRPLKFAKYLPEFGWAPIVLAATNLVAPAFDPELLEEINGKCRIVWTKPHWIERLRAWTRTWPSAVSPSVGSKARWPRELVRRFFIPDGDVVWKPVALRAVDRILKREEVRAIWTTAPPNSTHLVGLETKRRFGLRWVCDFRDHWIGNPLYGHLGDNPERLRKEAILETAIVRNADVVVSTTDGATGDFQTRYPGLAHKFVTIPNGFDEADFDGVCPSGSAVSPPDKFVIRYVGSMGGCRQADDLLAVLRSLGEHRMWHDLRLDFLGPFNQPKQPWMDALGDRVQFRPSVAHRQALRELRSAAVLLLVQNPECGPEFAVPGKAYEYAAARVPILALTPAGEVQKLVETYRLGRSVDSTDHPRLTETLLEMYDAWRRKETHSPEASFFRVFSRRAEAKVLSGLLCG